MGRIGPHKILLQTFNIQEGTKVGTDKDYIRPLWYTALFGWLIRKLPSAECLHASIFLLLSAD